MLLQWGVRNWSKGLKRRGESMLLLCDTLHILVDMSHLAMLCPEILFVAFTVGIYELDYFVPRSIEYSRWKLSYCVHFTPSCIPYILPCCYGLLSLGKKMDDILCLLKIPTLMGTSFSMIVRFLPSQSLAALLWDVCFNAHNHGIWLC